MKKIISAVLVAASLLSSVTVLAENRAEDIMPLLSELNIMVGDADGNLRLDDYVSRAEFAKIAIASSKSKNTVAAGIKVSPFKDVTYKHWSAPYVRAAVNAGIVAGYVDATFKPDNTVSYEEALTMVLKVLGYSDEDFGYSWPYGQIGLADNLEITMNMNSYQGEMLTRRQVATLIHNALGTKMKDSQTKLISVFDCEIIEDVTIIASHNEDSSLAEDKIFTTSGTYEIDDSFNTDFVGRKGDIYVKNGDDVVAFAPSDDTSNSLEKYVIYSQLPDAVVGYKNGGFEQIDITDGTTCYKDSAKSTYAAVKNEMAMGDVLYVKRDGTAIDYVTYEKGSMEGPLKVNGSEWIAAVGANSNTVIMRDGTRVTSSEIQVNDILYYSTDMNMVLAYNDKVTGVYEKASPTKDSPISVTISGNEYSVESVDAFNALSSSGTFKYGDTITVLLGRDGEIAGVAGGSEASSVAGGGFVIETGKKDFTNADGTTYSSYYAKVVMADGSVNEYATKNDTSNLKCAVVRVTFKDGRANLSRQSANTNISGEVDAAKNKIGDYTFADNVKILDTVGTQTDDVALYTRIYPQRLNNVNITSSRVLYSSKNATGEIEELILSDITGDCYDYGVVTKYDKSTSTYTIDINGSLSTHTAKFSARGVMPYKFRMNNGQLDFLIELVRHKSYISELTRTEALIGNVRYLLSDEVVVYTKKLGTTYMKIPLDDAINGDYDLAAYYDKSEKSGGRIRVIIAE